MKEEKQYLLDEIHDLVNRYPAFIVTSYEGMHSKRTTQFRREIEKFGGSVQVVKKRLLNKVAEQKGIHLPLASLPGHIALVLTGQDAVETLKYVFRFSKENSKAVKVVAGALEGAFYSGEQIERLSELPGKDEMRAQLLATLEAPLSQTLAVMEALLCSVPYCLDNKIKETNE